ncbi:MAG: efflux RND transporter periplasmic adaptor subunit [Prolixibacteraceae bacterium]|jgi:cobalt-zinc-cadmium efflux system membrane fusion protein|nr:efflux RND transporter periplasmic adaptor subunit [Prolixibacteraceae bacterium]
MITIFKKNRILFFSALAGWFLFACSSEQKKETKEVVEAPPSVTAETRQAIIELSEKDAQTLHIETVAVGGAIENYTLSVPGVVFPAPGNLSLISTPIEGRVSAIYVREGNRVKRGQELFRIESLVFGNLVAEFMQAYAEEKYQKSRLDRLGQLVQETISSKSELERANSDFQRANALVIASIAKLKAIGVTDREIENFKSAEQINPTLRIYSIIDGIFDQQEVELGQSVNALEKLGRVINLSRVQVKAYLSPDDGAFVSEGDTVLVTRRSENAIKIKGQVETINPALDETNRSMVANIIIDTENSWPQPGETVRLEIMTGKLENVLSVPVSALTYEGNQPIVFVKKGDRQFEKREIILHEIRDNYVVLQSGLQVGEQVAVTQVFSLKALSRYEQIAEE